MSHKEYNKFKVIKPKDFSRYFEQGRKKIKARIFKRLGRWGNVPGVLVTLTFDPKLYTKDESWYYVGKLRREFLNRINSYRRKKKWPKVKSLSCLEVQKGTGYPHVHIVFPYLKWLADIKEITKAWDQGPNAADVKYRDNFSPTSYVLKYITKMDNWGDEHFNYIWLFGTRLYSMSRDYSLPNYADKKLPEWKFYAYDSTQALCWWWLTGKHLLQRIREGPQPFDHGAIVRSQFGDIDVDLPQDI